MGILPSEPHRLDLRLKQAALLLLLIGNVAALMALLIYARPVLEATLNLLAPFFVAVIVAYIFHPIVSFLQCRFKLSRLSAVGVTYTLILSLASGFVAIMVPLLWKQLRELTKILIGHLESLKVNGLEIMGAIKLTPEEVRQYIEVAQSRLEWTQVGRTVGNVASQAVDTTILFTGMLASAFSGTVGLIAFFSFVIVITFYFLCDYSKVSPFLHKSLGGKTEERFFELWGKVDKSLGGYLRGQLTVAAFVGTIYGLGLMLIGMKPFAILIGFMTGVGNLIPYVGPTLGAIPALIWVVMTPEYPELMDKVVGAGLVLGLTALVQGLDGFILHPRYVGKGAELHPLAILLALVVGAQFGLGGLVLCVPMAIVIRVLLDELWWKPLMVRREAEAAAAGVPLVPESDACAVPDQPDPPDKP